VIAPLRRSSYEVEVAEDTPEQTTVARVHASDADAGENGHVTYRWSDQTDGRYGSVFGIDAETGEVFLKSPLDYEQQQVYKVRTVDFFWVGELPKVIPMLSPLPRGRLLRLEKFREDTLTSPRVIGANMLNFRRNVKCSRLKFFTLSPFGCVQASFG